MDGMTTGHVDLACLDLSHVEPERRTAAQLVGLEPPGACRGPERLGTDRLQILVAYRAGGGGQIDGLAVADAGGGVASTM
jgi:hypothetical protein